MVTEPYAHGTISRYTAKKCRCDECCAAQKQYMDAWRRAHGLKVGPFTVVCSTCGATFVARTSVAKYCSRSCKPKTESQSRRSTCRRCRNLYPVAEDAGRIRTGLCAKCQESVANDRETCGLCGVRWWNGDGNEFCSDECKNLDAARRAIIEEDYL